MERQDDLVQLLPDGVLADVLRRLAPRSLAKSRCVCKAWRAVIDEHRLLLPDLLPHMVGGIFINFNCLSFPEFFSRPSTGTEISGKLDCLPLDLFYPQPAADHCNGLLLLHDYVVNPATRQWARLPRRPPPPTGLEGFFGVPYLVFDPTISPHYEVFLIPLVPREPEPAMLESEWPPSPCVMSVFSSRIRRWEERLFVREGEAAGIIADIRLAFRFGKHYAVYWRGALYVHCQGDFVMRISLSDDKYTVIKLPIGIAVREYSELYLGKSEDGVHCALVHGRCQLQVWFLNESGGQMEWVLKHSNDLEPMLARRNNVEQINTRWILQNVNYDLYHFYLKQNEDVNYDDDKDNEYVSYDGYVGYDEDDNNGALVEGMFEWNSGSDNVLGTEDRDEAPYDGYISILGFDPYREVVFLCESLSRGLAYHLNSSKVERLGNLCPKLPCEHVDASFPYTPCWMGEFC